MKRLGVALLLTAAAFGARAQERPLTDFQSLLDSALARSPDVGSARWETAEAEGLARAARRAQFIPKVELAAAHQRLVFERALAGRGRNQILSLTVGFDLQKLLGAEAEVAGLNARYVSLRARLARLDLARNVKQTFALIKELEGDLKISGELLARFKKVNGVLDRQRRLGVFNALERGQFALQESLLENEIVARRSELDRAYFLLAELAGVEPETLKARVEKMPPEIPLKLPRPAPAQNENALALRLPREDRELAAREFEAFVAPPLPTVFLRGTEEAPTNPTSDGPSSLTEAGISFPLDAGFSRSAQKSALRAKAERVRIRSEKAITECRHQFRRAAADLARFAAQTDSLRSARAAADKLFGQSFLFFSQKRTDAMGTLDLFQKYLVSERNLLLNRRQIQTLDAELEYLNGDDG